MANKQHLQFRGEQILTGRFSYRNRYNPNNNNADPDPDYRPMQDVFRQSLASFTRKRALRRERRNPDIRVAHKDYVQLNFYGVYDIAKFERIYRERFGLSPVTFWNYNRSGLFIIEFPHRFEAFIQDVQTFIDAEDPLDENVGYSPTIRFIKSFDGFSIEEMLKIYGAHRHVVIDVFKTLRLSNQFFVPVREQLQEYLEERDITYEFNPRAEILELTEPTLEILVEIANNFDIIYSISSHDSGIIRPSRFGEPIREYGFTINENGIRKLPIIGVLDSGVSDQSPLEPLLIRANTDFDLTQTDPFDDDLDHGTGVAALAALGTRPYPDFRGELEADALILPIKIIQNNNNPLSQKGILDVIRRANQELDVRIFVLTVTWDNHKKTHEKPSEYTFALDQLVHELDILIFISTGNRNDLLQGVDGFVEYPVHFLEDESNLKTPADSMNNVTVGAIADNLTNGAFDGFSVDRNYPAVYSRKFHYDWDDDDLKQSIVNLKLTKPDFLLPGGDYDREISPDVYGIKVLSADPRFNFNIMPGTSYAAPLAANLAARLMNRYPEITSMQTIKALMLNASREIKLGPEFEQVPKRTRTAICGQGIPDEILCMYSDDHRASFVLEGSLRPERMEVYELKLPEYLLDASKDIGLLKVHATLCFSFDPVPDSQLAYCPIHFAFGFFKNVPVKDIQSKKLSEVKLKQGWSEDYYYGKGILSNAQKVEFSISKPDLVTEENTVRFGIHSKLHKHLDAGRRLEHNREHSYSLVVCIEETTREQDRTFSLYDQLIAINELDAIAEIEVETIDLEAEA